ncbi:MarR family winged helix-turn-helix transcriptional regulator [Enterorhabdus sp. P55]|uniref:MarR family winged helix-turn-helix transcriptional regulator n=1 Tax=Enterorhabdus sp. P55 TaxID=2304571 RepID=UPI0013715886|nr:MarR family winged helix-turn-helix transcriptional regulator [Enterorhabdus sp. P55]NBI31903.1 MarR family transcriptional regulator [Enterorhabdus sp. P55]
MERTIETMKVEFLDLMRKLHRAGPPWMPDCEGLTPNQARALHLLYVMESADGAGARPGSLAHHLAVSPSAFSQVARVLEERGLVTRGRGSGDFRAVSLRLTPEGVALARELDSAFTARMRELVDYVGPELFSQMMDGVAKVVEFRLAETASAAEAGPSAGPGAEGGAGPWGGEEAGCTC